MSIVAALVGFRYKETRLLWAVLRIAPVVCGKISIAKAEPELQSAVSGTVRHTNPEGIDYGWVMQVTFIITILVGVPIVAILSLFVSVPTWSDRAAFAIQAGAPVWFFTALLVFFYERRRVRLTDSEM